MAQTPTHTGPDAHDQYRAEAEAAITQAFAATGRPLPSLAVMERAGAIIATFPTARPQASANPGDRIGQQAVHTLRLYRAALAELAHVEATATPSQAQAAVAQIEATICAEAA